MILVSACLMGRNCRYDGGNKLNTGLNLLLKGKELILICPEAAGGLSIPRPPAEIQAGDGFDVLEGKANILNARGEDVTEEFIKGAERTLAELPDEIDFAILKAKSPSCGVNRIYSGTFDGTLKDGSGVLAAYLKKRGIPVFTEEELDKIEKTD